DLGNFRRVLRKNHHSGIALHKGGVIGIKLNAGENSGGPLCLKYGVTSNHILGMEVVLADGEILNIGGPALDPSGYDLRGLMVGSEGGLGIITELTLRILPKTEDVITMLAVYDDIHSAALSVSKIISAGIVPNTLEMMDALVIEAVEANAPCGYPTDAAAVLIIEVEGMTVGLKEQAQQIQEICMATNCRDIKTAKNQEERDRLWQGRRGAFGAIARLAPNYLVNDACVPRTQLPEALVRVNDIAEKYGCRVGNVFHAGDGNLHPLLLFDSRNPEELDMVHKAGWAIMSACVELGGTISGEHGIGREKQAAMPMIFSKDDLAVQRRVKAAFDPEHILNPNKVIPEPSKDGKDPQGPTVLDRPGLTDAKGVAGVMDAVKAAHTSGVAFSPVGAGHFKTFGNMEKGSLTPLSTSELTEVVEYDTANLFITLGSGTTLAGLQEKLAENNQWLPIRPPFFQKDSTLGALAAMGVSGPERMFYGAPRDFALGLRFVNSQGQVISTGGKVVKNVAGYDMTRTLVGSNGTLGAITEVSWRVATRPEACKAVLAQGSLEDCHRASMALMTANLFPTFAAARPAGANSGSLASTWELVVGFEDLAMVVDHKVERCQTLLAEMDLSVNEAKDYDLIAGCFQPDYEAMAPANFILKGSAATIHLAKLTRHLETLAHQNNWLVDFGCGRIFSAMESLTPDQWAEITAIFDEVGGHVQLEKSPDGFRRTNDVYGSVKRPEWEMAHRIKKALDPNGIFAPGRLPNGANA
ncbi:MAG: FAD-binding protein, partial [Desulfobacterales bacterium]|nr:FAD-binding protein [Desulfobacterales bacterium]